jgi:tetratricopeptide (TPR) repeat protein
LDKFAKNQTTPHPTFLPNGEGEDSEANQERLFQLLRSLKRASRAGFTLLFAVVNFPPLREKLVLDLWKSLEAAGIRLMEIELKTAVTSLTELLSVVRNTEKTTGVACCVFRRDTQHVTRNTETVVFLYGLERSLSSTKPYHDLLASLNKGREVFREAIPFPVVLWLPRYAVEIIARQAPDFWAWQSGIYEFEAGEHVQAALQVEDASLSTFANLPEAEKRERLTALYALLSEYENREDADKPEILRLRADILLRLGILYRVSGEFPQALQCSQQALEIYQQLRVQAGIASSLNQLGHIFYVQRDLTKARYFYENSLKIFQELDDKNEIANSLRSLGILRRTQGDYAEAKRLFEEGLTIFRQLNDKEGIANSLRSLGWLRQAQGDYAEAERLYEESLKILRQLNKREGIAYSLNSIGGLRQDQGDYAEAKRLYEESLTIFRQLGYKRRIAISIRQIGDLAYFEKNYCEAERNWLEALAIFEELKSPQDIDIISQALAGLKKELKNPKGPQDL